ncbi:MAG: hypothetical protein K2H60_03495 [Muribaculaceae bacterium]|nr:hypothetical protein [Muribaculaceae bacterium]
MRIKRLNYRNPEFASQIYVAPLEGPFTYDKTTIDSVIPEGIPGNYILGDLNADGDLEVRYVGRSDSDLRTRIGHDIGKYSHFYFSIAESAREAYNQECLMWHQYGGEEGELDNDIHPDKPDGDHSAECYICKLMEAMK